MPASASPRPQAKAARLSAHTPSGIAVSERRFTLHIVPVTRLGRGTSSFSLDAGSGDTPALCGTTLRWEWTSASSVDAAFPACPALRPHPGIAPSSPRAPPFPFA